MKSRPILFSATMVLALLSGIKTQTRRVVKTQQCILGEEFAGPRKSDGFSRAYLMHRAFDRESMASVCPYGQPGDQLWVRETFVQGHPYDTATDRFLQFDADGNDLPMNTWYRADGADMGWSDDDGWQTNVPWKPSIHMPHALSRITLEIVSVRVERLQDISEADAQAEGVHTDPACPAYDGYQALWESINGPGSWDANPWVWVVKFKKVTP